MSVIHERVPDTWLAFFLVAGHEGVQTGRLLYDLSTSCFWRQRRTLPHGASREDVSVSPSQLHHQLGLPSTRVVITRVPRLFVGHSALPPDPDMLRDIDGARLGSDL